MMDQMRQNFQDQAAPLMRRKREAKPLFDHRPKRIWLISFTDFMSLMVAFFVMSYSMLEPRDEDFKAVASALKNQFETVPRVIPKPFMGAPGGTGPVDTITLKRSSQRMGLDLTYLAQVLDSKRETVPALKNLVAVQNDTGLMIELPLRELRAGPAAEAVAYELAGLLQGTPNRVELVILPDAADPAARLAALSEGRIIATALNRAGLVQDMPIVISHLAPATPAKGGTLALRVTRYDSPSSAPARVRTY